jgi:hypothetical protein
MGLWIPFLAALETAFVWDFTLMGEWNFEADKPVRGMEPALAVV